MLWLAKPCRAEAKALTLAALLLSGADILKGQVSYINQYPVAGGAVGITAGPDGAMWFADNSGKIGRITTAGVITEYPLPTNGVAWSITTGPDGALWFTEPFNLFLQPYNKVGRITTAGVITEYDANGAWEITAGPDGALWFTESDSGKIGRITTAGIVTEYPLAANSGPWGITTGPDGALWFPEYGSNKIGRITTAGVITEYPLLTPYSNPEGIAAGADGALWFTEPHGTSAPRIGRITTAGTITEYPTSSVPLAITAGPDGALWFTEWDATKIGRITPGGVLSEYPLPTTMGSGLGITVGPDGAVWFTENVLASSSGGGFVIEQAVLTCSNPRPVSHVTPLPASEAIANFLVQWSSTDPNSCNYAFAIYVSDNAGPFTTWIRYTESTQSTFSGILGHTYGFYSIAWAGSQESPKSAPDTTTYVAAAPGDLNSDGAVNCADINVVMASFGKFVGQPGYNPVADVNHDGVVNVKDLSWVSQYLVPGTQCQ